MKSKLFVPLILATGLTLIPVTSAFALTTDPTKSFIGYTWSNVNSTVKSSTAYIYHGKNNGFPDTEYKSASIWTMVSNSTGTQLLQCGLLASDQMDDAGREGSGYPKYFMEFIDTNNQDHMWFATTGSAEQAAHGYVASWTKNSNGTYTLNGQVDGHNVNTAITTSAWAPTTTVENAMEVQEINGGFGIGFGSSTYPEEIYAQSYVDGNGTSHSLGSTGASKIDDSARNPYLHWGNITGASDFKVYDTEN